MSLPLKDFRGKITTETDCVLEALNRVTGRDRSEIARDVMHEWALKKLDEHNVLGRLLKAEGIAGSAEGVSGSRRESKGVRGRAGE